MACQGLPNSVSRETALSKFHADAKYFCKSWSRRENMFTETFDLPMALLIETPQRTRIFGIKTENMERGTAAA